MSTSNFIQTIQISNLTKKYNALATTVSNIIVDGAPVIQGDVDMNGNSIVEIDQLVFNTNHALADDNGTLQFANKNVVIEDDLENYQLKVADANLDMNNHSLLNVNGFQLIDNTSAGATHDFTLINGGLVSNDSADVRIYLYTNESAGFPSNLDFRDYPLSNVGPIHFSGGSVLAASDDTGISVNGNEITTYTLQNDLNGVNQYALRQVSTVQITSGGGVLFGGVQNKLVPDADDDTTLLYQNIPIITSNNISDYAPPPVFVSTANSNLNMGNYNITNCNNAVSAAVGTNSINFNNDPSKKLTVLGGDLQYQGATVLTNSDIASYIPAPSFVATANADLNMNNYAVRDCTVGEFNSINFAGNSNYHLSATADGLLYNGVQVASINDVQDNSIIFNNIDAKQNKLTNLSGVGFGGGSNPQNLESTPLTMSNTGDLLWNESIILTEANSNIPPANVIYQCTDSMGIITNTITINPNSMNYLKGTAVGSTFVIEFSAIAINIGGDDPAFIPDSETTNIIHAPSDTAFDLVGFNATSAGVYFGIAFKQPTTDTIVIKIENINNL